MRFWESLNRRRRYWHPFDAGRPGSLSAAGITPRNDRGIVSLEYQRSRKIMAKIWPGTNYPLGASHDGTGTNFSLFSEVADRVELCLFDEAGTETKFDCPR